MRIAIRTLPLQTNYGGILQCYALQTVLERMGHEVVVLDPTQIKAVNYPAMVLRAFRKFVLRQRNVDVTQDLRWESRRQCTRRFVKKYIHLQVAKDFTKLDATKFDVLVVGSDQVWRPIYCDDINNSFLDFAENWTQIKRVAYAASFGTEQWEYTEEQTKRCGELIKLFDWVSVREESGITLCRNHFDVEAHHVLDPTMLLDASDYTKLVNISNVPASKGNMMVYILDQTEEINHNINLLANSRGLIPFDANPIVQPLPVEQWLRGFMDAELVVTDSFHACAFSIIFNKPFICLGNKDRGMSRFTSLLNTFGLEKLLIKDSFSETDIPQIDWSTVNTIRKNRREESLRLLSSVL